MKNYNLDIIPTSKKVIRALPKDWEFTNRYGEVKQVDVEFCSYCERLYDSFLGIKKYYEKEFNKDNIYSIDDCIKIFDDNYNKILNVLCHKKMNRNFENLNSNETRFDIIKNRKKVNKDAYKFDVFGKVCGFSDWGYEQILPFAKQIFMLEKFCAFTTRKFWKKEITKIENLDMSKPFKILVKTIFPYTWRVEGTTPELQKFYNDRIYSSTSLIDEKSIFNLFSMPNAKVMAALIVEFKDKNFVCAANEDSFSEEKIDNENKLVYKVDYSDVLLADEVDYEGKNHKCYAGAVETETPKNILNTTNSYSEINIKNVKIVGVLAPNAESYQFAKSEAEKRGLPLFIPEGLKSYMKQNPEEFEKTLK